MSEFAPEYEFDYRNFNTVIREIFIHHANQLTGFDPEQGNLSEQGMSVDEQVKVYDLAQAVAMQVRQLCQAAYEREMVKQKAAKNKQIVPPLAAYALVIYERYTGGLSLSQALKIQPGKHSKAARDLYEKLEPEPVDMAEVEALIEQKKGEK